MKLVFASNNKDKIEEIKSQLNQEIKILSLQDIGCNEEIVEIENTLEGNAKLKANYITNNYKYNCFADDTGLEVVALNGEPGVYSARYAGENVTYEDNVNKILLVMKGVHDRKAQFRTVIALNLKGEQYVFEGACKGTILEEKHGDMGFGYDPIFKPDGFHKTFAEMSLDEKALISHRGLAVKKLIDFLSSKV